MVFLHPLATLVYYISVIGLTMLINNPICTGIAIVGSLVHLIMVKGTDNMGKTAIMLIPMVLITAAINPLFSHEGVTVLGVFPSGNILTLESVLYGLNMSAILLAVVLWFVSVNVIMTAERIRYVLGRVFPVLALTFSMTLHFIPRIRKHIIKVSEVKRVMYGNGANSLKNRITGLTQSFTWILNDSVDTADSMRCRGYGLAGRSSYSRYIFRTTDGIWIGLVIILTAYVIWGVLGDHIYWQYYPYVKCGYNGFSTISVYIAYVMLCLLPTLTLIKASDEKGTVRA